MNIIIAGDGEVGVHLAKSLTELDHNITVVDPHSELLKRLESETDLMTCILAKKLKAKKTVARISNAELLNPKHREMFRELGVDELVCPERIAAREITNLLNNSVATEFFDFSGGLLTMYVVRIDEGSPVVGHDMKELAQEHPDLQVRVVAILRRGETLILHRGMALQADDQVYLIGRTNQMEGVNQVVGKQAVEIRRVMMAGGGRIGRYAAMTLQDKMRITLIEEDHQRAEELSALLDDTLIISGDATDIDLLKEEGLENVDAFIGVTDSSETNVLTCLHAKRLGVKRTIALVENTGFIEISQDIGIDTIINKKLITASYIARFIVKGDAVSSKWLSGTNAEVMELIVGKRATATKVPLGELAVPEGATVGGVIRGRETLLPSRELQLAEGDKVVIFTLPKSMSAMVKLFE